jgi:hypothetical protein
MLPFHGRVIFECSGYSRPLEGSTLLLLGSAGSSQMGTGMLYERTQVMTVFASFPRKRESSNLNGNSWQKQ